MSENSRPTSRHTFVVRFLAGFLLVLLTTVAVTFLLPEIYSSTARLEVGAAEAKPGETAPAFVQAQIEQLRSREVLHPVIERLRLNESYARRIGAPGLLPIAECYKLLSKNLVIRPASNARLIEIRVFSEDVREAAETANGIAAVYRDTIGLSKGVRVELVDRAEPGWRPVRPNVRLNVTVGAFLGTLAGMLCGGIGWLWALRRGASHPELGGGA